MIKNITSHSLQLIIALFFFCNQTSGQNQNISQGILFDGEPYIMCKPSNSEHIVILWMGYSFGQNIGILSKTTFDGGTTWSIATTLPHLGSSYKSADPSLAFDTNGDLFACYVDFKQDPDSGAVVLSKSIDGGLTWNIHSQAIDAYDDGLKLPIDRPWLRINPINNHFYITTKPAPWIPAPNRPYFIASLDGGLNWQPWKYLDAPGFLSGNFIEGPMAAFDVGSDGIFHTFYPTYVFSQNILPGFIHASSANSGETFSYNGGFYAASNGGEPSAKSGYTLRINPTDPQHLAFVFTTKLLNDLDIYLVESLDGGINWSSSLRVNDDTPNNGITQDLPWLSFNEEGALAIAWRDRRNSLIDGYAAPTSIWIAIRPAGAGSFLPNTEISDVDAPYIEIYQESSGNDFMSLDYKGDILNSAWADVRNNILEIWFDRRTIDGGVLVREVIASEVLPEVQIFPNPAKDVIQIIGKELLFLRVFDTTAKEILAKQITGNIEINIS